MEAQSSKINESDGIEPVQSDLDIRSNCTETNSDTESISDEERVRRLFAVCDADGDGYIDSHDLVSALQELGLEGAINVEDLMQQMGADNTQGKVSFEQFLQCRLSHKSEIEALGCDEPTRPQVPETWVRDKDSLLPTSSEHSLGVASGKQESWEFDSGARDLSSPEPSTLYKLIEAAGVSLVAGGTCPSHILDLANRLHLAALGSLRGEISELHARLQRAAQDRETLEQALAKTQLERLRLVQESEERLERQSTQYEERLTELHSVIAELTRKLNRQQYNSIKEEREEGDDEDVEEEEDEEPGEEEQDVPHSNDKKEPHPAGELGYSLLEGQEDERDAPDASSSCSSDLSFGGSSSDDEECARRNEPVNNQTGEDDLDAKAVQAGENLDQFVGLKETKNEVNVDPLVILNSENKELKMHVRRLGNDMSQIRNAFETIKNERDELRRQLEAASQQPRPIPLSAAASLGALTGSFHGSPVHQRLNNSSRVSSPVVVEEGPVCKVAERVRIRRLDGREKMLTGSQIASLGVRDARVAEQLVSSVHNDSVQGEANAGGTEAVRVNELELEVERLASRSEHLRAQNDVLSLTLAESRAMGERLAVLLGKYESNCMALRMALERADRVSEAFEVLAALVESEMALLLANCQVAGLGLAGRGQGSPAAWEADSNSGKDLSVLWKRATERRRSSENLARCLLARYDRERDHWEDSGRHTNTTTSSTSSGAESGSGSGSNPASTLEPTERKVRDIISRLKGDRASLESTIQQVSLPLESALIDPLPKDLLPLAEARKMDLEMAVIMQELMAMREERSRLRTQVYILEKERAVSEAAQQSSLAHLRIPIDATSTVNSTVATIEPNALSEGEEPCAKEKKLQLRVQELTVALERVTQSAELRSQQSAELVSDVKKANSTLVQLLERTKKKYQSRLKRLEQQMVNMSERHAMQVRVLKQRVTALEDDTSVRPLPLSSAPSETSL